MNFYYELSRATLRITKWAISEVEKNYEVVLHQIDNNDTKIWHRNQLGEIYNLMYYMCIFGALKFLTILHFFVPQCTINAPKWHQNGARRKCSPRASFWCIKSAFLEHFSFWWLCTFWGCNSPPMVQIWPLISNLHAIRSIFNSHWPHLTCWLKPILRIFTIFVQLEWHRKWLSEYRKCTKIFSKNRIKESWKFHEIFFQYAKLLTFLRRFSMAKVG